MNELFYQLATIGLLFEIAAKQESKYSFMWFVKIFIRFIFAIGVVIQGCIILFGGQS